MKEKTQRELHQDYVLRKERVAMLEVELRKERSKLRIATDALGAHFKPPGYRPGEVITTWIDGVCYSIVAEAGESEDGGLVYSDHSYVITERKEEP